MTYYHLLETDPNTSRGMVNARNLSMGNGILKAESCCKLPESRFIDHGFKSIYAMLNRNTDKEALFEKIRVEHYPDCATRMSSLFLWDDLETAKYCQQNWFGGKHTLFEAEIIEGRTHRVDASHLDCGRDEWEARAHLYWQQDMTDSPKIEVIVQGIIKLIGYEKFAYRSPAC